MKERTVFFGACAAILAMSSPALAAKGVGCDGFLWPLTTEWALMQANNPEKATSGSSLALPPADKAIELALQPVAQVKFPATPTKTPKPEDASTFGGWVSFDNMPEAGQYQVTLSAHGWIDVVQNGKTLEAIGHTGSEGCDAIRKSVRFEIASGPFSVQINGIRQETVKFTIRQAAD